MGMTVYVVIEGTTLVDAFTSASRAQENAANRRADGRNARVRSVQVRD